MTNGWERAISFCEVPLYEVENFHVWSSDPLIAPSPYALKYGERILVGPVTTMRYRMGTDRILVRHVQCGVRAYLVHEEGFRYACVVDGGNTDRMIRASYRFVRSSSVINVSRSSRSFPENLVIFRRYGRQRTMRVFGGGRRS